MCLDITGFGHSGVYMLRETVYTRIVAIGFYSPQGRNAKLKTSVLGHIFFNFYIRMTFTSELTAVNLLSKVLWEIKHLVQKRHQLEGQRKRCGRSGVLVATACLVNKT